jgi:hypothetical protein
MGEWPPKYKKLTPASMEGWVFVLVLVAVLIILVALVVSLAAGFWPGLLGCLAVAVMMAVWCWYDRNRPGD